MNLRLAAVDLKNGPISRAWLDLLDHYALDPMGGGEGRSSRGHPRSRKGLLAKGYKTRDPKKTTSKFIVSRRKK